MNKYIVENLDQNPEEIDRVIKLIEESFEYKEIYSYRCDFYPQFEKSNLKNCFIVKDIENKNNVIAHVGVLPLTFKAKNLNYTVNLIGSIAVEKKYRSKGVFNKIFIQVLDSIKNNGVLNILWSEKTELFNKYNFYECGKIYQSGNKQINFDGNTLDSITTEEQNHILRLYKNYSYNYFSPIRNSKRLKSLMNIKSCNIKFLKNSNEEVIGYLLFNKGGDLQDIIHEFTCDPNYYKEQFEIYKDYKIWTPDIVNQSQVLYSAFININNIEQLKILTQSFNIEIENSHNEIEILNKIFNNIDTCKNIPLWISGIDSI